MVKNLFTGEEFTEEDELKMLDSKLLQLRAEKNAFETSYRWRGRDIRLIEKEISDTEYERKLLYERLSVKSRAVNNMNNHKHENHSYFNGVIKDNTIIGDGTLIRFENQKNEKTHPKKWYEKPFGIVLLTIIAGGLLYLFGWN